MKPNSSASGAPGVQAVDDQFGVEPTALLVECRVLPLVQTMASGDIGRVLRAAQAAGADVTAVAVPDVRTPFADLVAPRSVTVSP